MPDAELRKNLLNIYRVILLLARCRGVELRAITVRYDTFFDDYTVFLGQPGNPKILAEVLEGCVLQYLNLPCRYVCYRGYAYYDSTSIQPYIQEDELGYLLKAHFVDYGKKYQTIEFSPGNFKPLAHGKN